MTRRNLRDGPYPMRRWHDPEPDEPSDEDVLRAAEQHAINVNAALGLKVYRLGPGVVGYTSLQRGAMFFPWVMSAQQGRGHFGRWLDSLPRDQRLGFIEVISPKLSDMLTRRGFTRQFETMDDGIVVEAWIREAE